MTITELIAQLEAIKAEYGDLEVIAFKYGMEQPPTPAVDEPIWRADWYLALAPKVLTLN